MKQRRPLSWNLLAAAGLIATSAGSAAWARDHVIEMKAELSGQQEVPPLDSRASGNADFIVSADGSIVGTVHTAGIDGVAAYIAQGAADVNGRVAVPLQKRDEDEWVTPRDAALTTKQIDAFRAGDLYVNIDTGAHPTGQIRGQLHE